MSRMTWPVAIVSLGFLALVGVIFWRASTDMQNFGMLWGAAGPIVGVVVGVIPGAAFGVFAQNSQRHAQERAEVYARHVPADKSSVIASELQNQS